MECKIQDLTLCFSGLVGGSLTEGLLLYRGLAKFGSPSVVPSNVLATEISTIEAGSSGAKVYLAGADPALLRQLKGGVGKFNSIGRMAASADFKIIDQGVAPFCVACSTGNSLRKLGVDVDLDQILLDMGSRSAVNIDKAASIFNKYNVGSENGLMAKPRLYLTMDDLRASVAGGMPAVVKIKDLNIARDASHALMVEKFVNIGQVQAVKIIDSQIGGAYYETVESFSKRFLTRTDGGVPVGYGVVFSPR